MNVAQNIPLEQIMPPRMGLVDPSAFPDEEFDLYSIPAFDHGEPEVLEGRQIGSAKQVVQPGDVLLSRIVPHIRRAWVVGHNRGRRIIASGEWIVFRDEKVDPRYLRHVLVSDPFHAEFMRTVSGVGGSLLRARPAYIAKIHIPLPPLPEQQRIAEILNKAEVLRDKRRAALAQLDTLIQSIFLDMFGDPAMILHRWPVSKLGDHLEFLTSGSRGWAKLYSERGDLFLRIQNVRRDELSLDDIAYVKAPDTAEARRTRVEPGDVLLSITADLGRTAVVPKDLGNAFINQHLALLRTKSLVPRFLSAFLASPAGRSQVLRQNRQAVKAGLNFDDIRGFVVPFPPVTIQRMFEATAAAVGASQRAQCEALTQIDALFSSLQYCAFQEDLKQGLGKLPEEARGVGS